MPVTDDDIKVTLEGHYPMGVDFDDYSGNNRHGIVSGAIITADQAKIHSKSGFGEGVDDYSNVGTNEFQFGNNYTYAGWVYVPSGAGNANRDAIFSTFGRRSSIGFFNDTTIYFSVFTTDFQTINITIPNDTWFFVMVRKKSSGSDSAQIRIDDTTENSIIRNGNVAYVSGETRIFSDVSGDRYGKFYINELMIWNRVLPADEETYLYNGGAGRNILGVGLSRRGIGRGLNRGVGRGV